VEPSAARPELARLGGREVRNLAYIFLISLALLIVMRLLEWVGIISALTRLLRPGAHAVGHQRPGRALTIIGMTLGLTYGGGLIIQEARAGKLSRFDVFLPWRCSASATASSRTPC